MRKLLFALCAVFVMASFTNTNNTTILKDIDGTLLKSNPVVQQTNGEYTVTFNVDANTVVTTNTVDNATYIYLIANGNSGVSASHSINFNAASITFRNYVDQNTDVASADSKPASKVGFIDRPKTMM
jgi:hypothetical protein